MVANASLRCLHFSFTQRTHRTQRTQRKRLRRVRCVRLNGNRALLTEETKTENRSAIFELA